MGYYIEVPENKGKAKQLVDLYEAKIIQKPSSFNEIPTDKALICVVVNPSFDAALFCYSNKEFQLFSYSWDDGRPKIWLLMDLEKTKELTGYSNSTWGGNCFISWKKP